MSRHSMIYQQLQVIKQAIENTPDNDWTRRQRLLLHSVKLSAWLSELEYSYMKEMSEELRGETK